MLSKNLEFLEKAFDILNQQYFENALSKSVITIQKSPRAYGHFTLYKAWEDDKTGYYEINIGAETLNRPLPSTIATLVHEMTHQYCFENGIKDTSRGGTYHNKRFKAEAERRGLMIEHSPRIGYSVTQPAPELINFCTKTWGLEIEIHRKSEGGVGQRKKKPSSTRKYTCPQCGQSVRATKEVNILCGVCNVRMETEADQDAQADDGAA